MSKKPVLSIVAVVLAAALLSLIASQVVAATAVLTPAGTKVGLMFLDPVDTGKARHGDTVHFKIAGDVVVNRHVVIKKGTMLTGTVKEVGHPFPQNSGYANISGLAVSAVDKSMVGLKDVRVSAPLLGGDIRVAVDTPVTTETRADVTIKVPSDQR